ncbi:hypothetical protein MVEN_02179700 [Mycena venus]|uniref:Uncharacterized protein n=1 Tax=Mycena venus TaxID=2733690 RepID=A0A8H7CI70_9AGAR|nr:hypothetical protein MVEN_02179700 [Mycena venus]
MPGAYRCPYCQISRPTQAAVNRHISQKPACYEKWRQSLGISVGVTREESEPPAAQEPPPAEPEVSPSRPPSLAFFSHELPEENELLDDEAEGYIPPVRAPKPLDPLPCPWRPTVEEVPDEDDPQMFRRFPEPFPGQEKFPGHEDFVKASETTSDDLEKGETVFEAMKAAQDAAGLGPHAPFLDSDEWELASWLSKNVSQTATDAYLTLPITQRRTKVSYHNNYAYLQKVDQLPTGPGWKYEIVTAAGNQLDENDEIMQEDLELWKRDPVECIKDIRKTLLW